MVWPYSTQLQVTWRVFEQAAEDLQIPGFTVEAAVAKCTTSVTFDSYSFGINFWCSKDKFYFITKLQQLNAKNDTNKLMKSAIIVIIIII